MRKITLFLGAMGLMASAGHSQNLVLDNFEDGALSSRYRAGSGNSALFSVVDNPLKSGINTSNKAFRLTNNSGSAYFMLDLNQNEQAISTDGYNRFRFKYYAAPNADGVQIGDITAVRLQLYGSSSTENIRDIKPKLQGVWETITYEIPVVAAYNVFQIRLNYNRVSPASLVTDNYYIDDVEFFYTDGTTTSVGENAQARPVSCYINSATGQAFLNLAGYHADNARAILYHITGQEIKTIFHGSLSGQNGPIPFTVEKPGIYIVKVVAGNKILTTAKLIAD
ncbi:MAG: hypothetical protein QM786_02880 [Breznakibacter sp.]